MSAEGSGTYNPVIGDERYGEAVIDLFEERGISWTAWVFDPVWSPQVFEDWETFEPTTQGRFFRDKMRQLNSGNSGTMKQLAPFWPKIAMSSFPPS